MAERLVDGVARPPAIGICVDGRPHAAYEGETVAAALAAAGVYRLRDAPNGAARGLYCNMGVCYECLVAIAMNEDDRPRRVRACLEPARDGMIVTTLTSSPGSLFADAPKRVD